MTASDNIDGIHCMSLIAPNLVQPGKRRDDDGPEQNIRRQQ